MELSSLFAFMRQFMRIGFPVLPIKIHYINRRRPGVQAVNVDINAVWVRSCRVKRFDTADLTKRMLGNTCIEGVGNNMILP